MATISLQIPVVGSPNATEDVKIASDLTILQTLLNGNVDTTNLSPSAAIALSQLAPGAGRLFFSPTVVSVTAANGALVVVNAGGVTISLPAPSLNAVVGVLGGTGVAPGSVAQVAATSGAHIIGLGVALTTGLQIGEFGGFLLFQCDGTNWWIVGGKEASGWVTIPLAAGVTGSCQCRARGDEVRVRAGFTNASGGAWGGGAYGTLPVNFRPPATYTAPGTRTNSGAFVGETAQISAAGDITEVSGVLANTETFFVNTTFSKS